MKMYGGYKVIGDSDSAGLLIMSHQDVDVLRDAMNAFFAKEENFVTRFKRQLRFPEGKMITNVACSDGGGQCINVFGAIREIELPGIPKDN